MLTRTHAHTHAPLAALRTRDMRTRQRPLLFAPTERVFNDAPVVHSRCYPLAFRSCGSVTLEHAHGLALSYAPSLGFRCVRFSSLRGHCQVNAPPPPLPLSQHTHARYLLCMMSVNRSAQHATPSPVSVSASNRTCANLWFLLFHITSLDGRCCVCCFFLLSFFFSYAPSSVHPFHSLQSSMSPRVAGSLWT